MTRYFVTLAISLGLLVACGGKDKPTDPAKTEVAATANTAKDPKAVDPAKDPQKPEATDVAKDPKTAEPTKAAGAVAKIEGPIAKVNGIEISSDEFYIERDKITSRGAKIPADRLARIEQNILKRLVEKELINQAVKAENVTVPAEDVKAGFDEYKKRFQSEEQFQNYLKHGKVTKDSIETRIRDRRALELLLEKKGNMAVNEDEAKEFYDKNERFYTEKAGVRASHVLIKLPQKADEAAEKAAMEKVAQVQASLKKGEDFGEVAKKMSEGPSAPKGGDLGFFGEGRMVKEFQEAAFAMKKGEVSEPVRTRFGFHIIKVTDKREDRKKSFDEVKDQIVKSLKNKKFFTERRKLLADLEKAAKVEKFLPEPPPAAAAPAHGPGDGHGHGPAGMPGHPPVPGGAAPTPGAVPVPAPAPTPAPAPAPAPVH